MYKEASEKSESKYIAYAGLGDRVFTPGQIAKICSVSPKLVGQWIDSGKLDGFRIPPKIGSKKAGERRSTRAQFVAFLIEHKQYHALKQLGIDVPKEVDDAPVLKTNSETRHQTNGALNMEIQEEK